jgi:hypothetical protein
VGTIEGIRRHGFRKWYERQLIEGHLWLVTLLLAVLVMASGFELAGEVAGAFDLVYDAMLVLGGGVLSGVSWRRYSRAMMIAEHVGHQAVCPSCERYGFRAQPDEPGADPRVPRLVASCPRCHHRWPIDPGT